LDSAIELYEQALAINQEIGSEEGMAYNYANLGIVYQSRGDLDKAKAFWEQTVYLYDSLGSPYAAEVRRWLSELPEETE